VAPLVAILLIPLTIIVAFALDIGRITVATGECQAAADSAALAGADQLMQGYVATALNGVTTDLVQYYEDQAIANAQAFAKMNYNIDLASMQLPSSLIEFGYTDASYNYTAGTYGQPITVGSVNYFPNTITVTLVRGTSGGVSGGNPAFPLYFGGMAGLDSTNIDVRARAIILNGNMSSLPTGAVFLPLAIDFHTWNRFIYERSGSEDNPLILNPWTSHGITNNQLRTGYTLTGLTDDQGNTLPGGWYDPGYNGFPITTKIYQEADGGDGTSELNIYPGNKLKGEFGMVSLNNDQHNSNATQTWITQGLSSSDIAALTSRPMTVGTGSGTATFTDNLYPIMSSDVSTGGNPKHNPALANWRGSTGLDNASVSDIMANIGQFAFLPVFAPAQNPDRWTGQAKSDYIPALKNPGVISSLLQDPNNVPEKDNQGNYQAGINAYFSIVGYVGITLTEGTANGQNSQLWVQPAAVIPKGATFINPGGIPAGSGAFSYSFIAPRLIAPQ
jgi:hypothetical protein